MALGYTASRVTGGTAYAGSGAHIPSGAGLVTTLSGPWCVEEQTMQVDYVRVPTGHAYNFPGDAINLSSVAAIVTGSYTVSKTELRCIITATYSKIKSYETYSTSSYQQPQKFEINSVSADAHGNVYEGWATSSLGPRGSIVTYQPFKARRLWNDDLDGSTGGVSKTITVANSSLTSSGSGTIYSHPQTQSESVAFENNFIENAQRHSFLHDYDRWSVLGANSWGAAYSMWGTYNPTFESQGQYISLLDNIGNLLMQEKLIRVPAEVIDNYPYIANNQGNQYYNINRHDYN